MPKPKPIADQIFFTVDQIEPGKKLLHVGRLDPNSKWVIKSVSSAKRNGHGYYKVERVNRARHLADEVELENVATKETRSMSVGYLSYSAIWRLE